MYIKSVLHRRNYQPTTFTIRRRITKSVLIDSNEISFTKTLDTTDISGGTRKTLEIFTTVRVKCILYCRGETEKCKLAINTQ